LAEDLESRLGDKRKEYSVPSLIRTVANIADLENTEPANRTVLTDLLIKILKGERGRIARIEAWNKRQK
jgi:hypothetical protein